MITRRNVLLGLAAPAIVNYTSLMPVRAYYAHYDYPHNPVTCENTYSCLVNGLPGLVSFTEDMSRITRIEVLPQFRVPAGVNNRTFKITKGNRQYPNLGFLAWDRR